MPAGMRPVWERVTSAGWMLPRRNHSSIQDGSETSLNQPARHAAGVRKTAVYDADSGRVQGQWILSRYALLNSPLCILSIQEMLQRIGPVAAKAWNQHCGLEVKILKGALRLHRKCGAQEAEAQS